jgi:ornithine lipid ester-linked acyl 2-hydroxylase
MANLFPNLKAQYRQWILREGEKAIRRLEGYIGRNSLVGDTPYLSTEAFHWIPELETNWKVIRQELDVLLEKVEQLPNFQDISRDQADITHDHLWKTYFFCAYGFKAQHNCQQCPETARILDHIPGINLAFFSILLPHKQIPIHRGPYKGVIRLHLPLKVPQPPTQCAIRVGDQIRHWEEGKVMLFDDTYPHEAWNHSDEIRVVLFIDVIRPMRFPAAWFNRWMLQLIAISPYVRGERPNFEEWDRRLGNIFSEQAKH